MAKEKVVNENVDELFNEDNIPESSFFKFKTIGDRVSGILVEVRDSPGRDGFGDQKVFSLKQKDNSITKVGIPLTKDYVIGRANTARMGDMLGFEYKKDIPSNKGKAFAPAKSLEVYVKHLTAEEEVPFI